jgi:N,N'-diacetylbacillosaminyl-diphospho-undecaprenol alpha-1,3-N-acetylgalactosaminyltransferase
MKIAIISPNDFSIVWFCGEIVRAMQDNGRNEIYVICDVHDGYKQGHYAEIMKSWGVKHIPITFYRFNSPLRDLKYTWDLRRILAANKMDMILNISTKPNVYGPIAGRLAGVRNIVCSVWGMGVAFAEEKSGGSALLRFFIRRLYKNAGRLSRKIWFTNELDHEYFMTNRLINKSKTILTKNYVNTDEYTMESVSTQALVDLRSELDLSDQEKVVVLVARMSWAKGIGEFVKAAEILRDELPSVRFLLVGPEDIGSSDSVPTEFLKESEHSGNIRWLGFRRDVKELYAICDLAVYPSFYREGGYPRGLTEPMAMGKPIITTDSPHCCKTVDHGKNGYIVPVRDAEALAGAIRDIISDDSRAVQFGLHSRRKVVEEFDEGKIIKELMREILPA